MLPHCVYFPSFFSWQWKPNQSLRTIKDSPGPLPTYLWWWTRWCEITVCNVFEMAWILGLISPNKQISQCSPERIASSKWCPPTRVGSDSVLSKTAIFPKKREGNVRFPTNLHGVGRSARPTSRCTPMAHRMMGKTHWRHCERSFGTNVLVLGKQGDNFPLLSEPLKTDVKMSL